MAQTVVSDAPAIACPKCSTHIAATLLVCPGCRWLVHAERLTALAREAEEASARRDHAAALAAWREALILLPAGSKQYDAIAARVAAVATDHAQPTPQGRRGNALSWVGVSAVVVFIATKGKFLLLGLTKGATLFSMLAALGVYWTQWGMFFALGFVLSIYVHEMGHVAALRRYGIPASAPMFVPGLGAFVRMRRAPASAAQDARVGLAGPIWGLGAALVAWAVFLFTGSPLWAAIARTGAWLNLFNLLPVWHLDGGRAFAALSVNERWIATAALAAAWYFGGEGLLVLLLIAAAACAAFDRQAPAEGDRGALAQYVALVAALTYITVVLPVSIP